MNSTGKTPTTSASNLFHGHRAAGFSLVEVLVTALLIGIGLLGLATLQTRAISFTTDAMQRSTAAMLAADLLELIRATPAQWSLYLQSATPSPAAADCRHTPHLPAAQLACWHGEVATLLPSTTTLPANASYVCRSSAAGICAPLGSAIEIQVAWKGAPGQCMGTPSHCYVRLRSEL